MNDLLIRIGMSLAPIALITLGLVFWHWRASRREDADLPTGD